MAPKLGLFIGLFWLTMMDPTLGQRTADATHLKLLNGVIESWTGILPTLGVLEIEVLSVGSPELELSQRERGEGGTAGTGSAEADG